MPFAATEIDVRLAKKLLSEGLSVADVAVRLGLHKKTFERAFARACGVPPGAWRAANVGSNGKGRSRVVTFRFAEYDQLAEVADRDDLTPNDWARNAVLAALRTALKKSK